MISTNAIFTKEVFTRKKIPIEMAEKLLMNSSFIPTLDSRINVDATFIDLGIFPGPTFRDHLSITSSKRWVGGVAK